MKRRIDLVVPGPIAQVSGGYIYDRKMAEGLIGLGHEVVVHELRGNFPRADRVARTAAEQCLATIGGDGRVVIDGLALPAFADIVDRLPRGWIALVHHPLALETGLPAREAQTMHVQEGGILRRAGGVIVTSRRTQRDVEAFGVEPACIIVVEPGTDRRPLARGSRRPFRLLTVGALVPRKGHDVLLAALAALQDLPWRLVCVGSMTRDPGMTNRLRDLIGRLGLSDRIELAGEVDATALDRHYDAADLFVLASHHEGFGMALQEALARGLPVVSTTAGAIPETVPAAAGVLVPPGSPVALAAALQRVIADAALRMRLRAGARSARAGLIGWAHAAARFAAALDALHGSSSAPRGSRTKTGSSSARAVAGPGPAPAARGPTPPERALMAGFSGTWLEAREAEDHRARSGALAARFAARLGVAPQVLDLGCGTGSNVRYLAPRLGPRQRWLCLDHDPALLEAAPTLLERWGRSHGLEAEPGDLGLRLRKADRQLNVKLVLQDLAGINWKLSFEGVAGLTSSALLDLASAEWLDALAQRIAAARLPSLFALSFDGRLSFRPGLAGDEAVRIRFLAHQQRDKGLGPALGPDAAGHLGRRLEALGHTVELASSDWRLGATERPLLDLFLTGLEAALRELEPLPEAAADWFRRRRREAAAGQLEVLVGHQDLLAL